MSEFPSEKSPEFETARQTRALTRRLRPDHEPFTTESTPAEEASPVVGQATDARRLRPAPAWLVVAAVVLLLGGRAWWVASRPDTLPPGAAPAASGEAAAAPLGSTESAPPGQAAAAEGTVIIESRPAGAAVFLGGTREGNTPLRVTLPVGSHVFELRNGAARRQLAVTVEADATVRQIVDLAPIARTGRLEVSGALAGTPVTVDGVARGVTPLVLDAVTPGRHQVVIGSGSTAVTHDVTVEAGGTASIVAASVPSVSEGGWVAFRSPVELQVFERGRLLGTTNTARLILSPGPHELELASDALEFRMRVTSVVTAGGGITLPVTLPNGELSINAVPWADVWIDGSPAGSTPLANVAVTIGDHEIVLRHPDLGERRQTVRVGAKTPTRVGVNLTAD